MKKLKKIWQENSVLLVLFIILIACLIAISVVVVKYFVGNEDKNNIRLEGVENHPFTEQMQNEIKDKIKEDEKVLEVKIIPSTKSKRITVVINFTSEVTLVEAQSKTLASLEYFSEDTLSFYDIQFNIEADSTEKSDGFKISGSHNVSGTGGIVWNNNTVPKDE